MYTYFSAPSLPPLASFPSPFPLKVREDENIQNRDWPFEGPSFANSCPRPLPHLPQETFRIEGDSSYFDTLSGRTVSVKAGQGEECSYFLVLAKSSLPHFEHTYIPVEVQHNITCNTIDWRAVGHRKLDSYIEPKQVHVYCYCTGYHTPTKTKFNTVPRFINTQTNKKLLCLPSSKWSLYFSPPDQLQKDILFQFLLGARART